MSSRSVSIVLARSWYSSLSGSLNLSFQPIIILNFPLISFSLYFGSSVGSAGVVMGVVTTGLVMVQALGSDPDTCLGRLSVLTRLFFRKQLTLSSMIQVQYLQPEVFSQRSIHSAEVSLFVSTPPPPKTAGRSSPRKAVWSSYRHRGSPDSSESRQLTRICSSRFQDFPSVNFHCPAATLSTHRESPL